MLRPFAARLAGRWSRLEVAHRPGADQIDMKLGDRLLEFGAPNLQDRRGDARGKRALLVRQHPQHRPLQREKIRLDADQARAERRILRQRPTVEHFRRGNAPCSGELPLAPEDEGACGALVIQKEFRIGPPLAGLADQVLGGNLDVVEKYLAKMRLAIQLPDSADGQAGSLMSISRKEIPLCGFTVRSVLTRKKPQSAS